jgi:hypothetical protein
MQNKLYWFAGIVDGEGSINAFYNSTGNYSVASPCVGFNITNTNIQIIRECQNVIEWITGWRPKEYVDRSGKRTKVCYKLSVRCHGRIQKILETIHPMLVGKKDQAFFAIALCKSFKKDSATPVNREYRVELLEKIKALNRGSIVETNTQDKLPNLPYCVVRPYPKAFSENLKIEPELTGDCESAPDVNQGSEPPEGFLPGGWIHFPGHPEIKMPGQI